MSAESCPFHMVTAHETNVTLYTVPGMGNVDIVQELWGSSTILVAL